MSYQTVVIIGAPRSGTNMLRDSLARLDGVGTWPCDEINYIWRHGNARHPSDAFTPEMATPRIAGFIRGKFDQLAYGNGLDTVVEKTCANSLRVGFVDRVLPEAKYVFITRDGVDAVGSALLRWKAKLDLPYILRKARYVPPSDLPYYALKYLQSRLHRLVSRENQLSFWGPKFDGMDEMVGRHPLEEICAYQWKACVESSQRDLARLAPERVIHVRYEDFVRNPVAEFSRLAAFVGKQPHEDIERYLRTGISSASIRKGYAALGAQKVETVRKIIGPVGERFTHAGQG